MYRIDESNLRFAYSKLKKYVYYYSSSNYLKDKLIEFENKLNQGENLFEKYSIKLNEIAKHTFYPIQNYNFDYIFYPKKDSFEANGDIIELKEVNAFIDMDIMFYLNDILFCFELYDAYQSIEEKHFFGNLLDRHLNRIDKEKLLENNMLFDPYWGNYQKWKKVISNASKNINGQEAALIKFDFKRCYYNTTFKLKDFLKRHNIDYRNPIVNISLNVYRLFSSKIYKLLEKTKEHQVTLLPLGLPSASIIQNIIFSDFDKKIVNNKSVLAYSRYVDDVLILINKNMNELKELAEIIDDIEISNNIISINVSNDLTKKLEINTNKVEIKKGISFSNLKNKLKSITGPSLVDFYDEEMSENSVVSGYFYDFDDQRSIKKTINKYFEYELKDTALDKFLSSIRTIDMLNAYSCWNKILYIFKDNNYKQNFIAKVSEAINKVHYTNNDSFFSNKLISDENIRKTLRNELRVSNEIINDRSYYLFNVTQNDIFDCIKLAIEERKIYFPIFIKIEYIELFLCLNYEISQKILLESKKLFYKINNIELNDKHPANNTTINVAVDTDRILSDNQYVVKEEYSKFYIFKLKQALMERQNYIKVGIMSAKIPIVDIKNNRYSKNMPFSTLMKSIKTAKKNKANYLVMPECCILFKDVIKVINYCSKNKISLIAGIQHYENRGEAVNFIVIYDNKLKIALLKEKNYYPYEEKLLLAEIGLKSKAPSQPYYFLIDDGLCTYSTMTCFEATNIRDRAFFNGKINVMFMPVYNKDTNYFSDIIGSFSRDTSAFVVQANNSEYGDSRITGPMDSLHKDIVKLKGGENCFIVVGTLDLKKMIDKHEFMEKIETEIDGLFSSSTRASKGVKTEIDRIRKEIKSNKESNEFKPLSAGCVFGKRKDV